jgi:hypothetical protein
MKQSKGDNSIIFSALLQIKVSHLYLIDFKFPAKHAGCHFPLISDITPSIPIHLFSLTASKQ